jgi:hypothetical protein
VHVITIDHDGEVGWQTGATRYLIRLKSSRPYHRLDSRVGIQISKTSLSIVRDMGFCNAIVIITISSATTNNGQFMVSIFVSEGTIMTDSSLKS